MKDSFEDRGYAPESFKYAENNKKLSKNEAHGTMVSSVIFQQAPKAKIIPMEGDYFYKFYNNKEILADIDAINISWKPYSSSLDNKFLAFIKLASRLDIPVFISAGDEQEQYIENNNCNPSLAEYLTLLSNGPNWCPRLGKIMIVGSSKQYYDEEECINEKISDFSGYSINAKSYIVFPGEDVPVYEPHSCTLTEVSGTSFSAPSAAAHYVLVKEFFEKNNIELSAQEISKLMLFYKRNNMFGDMNFIFDEPLSDIAELIISWNKMTEHEIFDKSLKISLPIQDDHLKDLKFFRDLKLLNLDLKLNDEDLKYVKDLENVEDLTLDCYIESESLKHLKNLKNLKKLAISDWGDEIKDLANLEDLNISDAFMTGEGLEHLENLKKLKILNINAYRMEEDNLKYIQNLKYLESLTVYKEDLTGKGLKYIQNLTNLEILDLLGCKEVKDDDLSYLQNLTKLKSLKFFGLKITGEGLKHIQNFPHLESLDISDCKEMTYEGLKYLSNLNLKTLILNGCNELMTDETLKFIAENFKNLTHLGMSCSEITDENFEFMAKNFKNLTYLDLSFVVQKEYGLPLKSLEHLQHLKNLKQLQIQQNDYVINKVKEIFEGKDIEIIVD
jgi:hypothetical protein